MRVGDTYSGSIGIAALVVYIDDFKYSSPIDGDIVILHHHHEPATSSICGGLLFT